MSIDNNSNSNNDNNNNKWVTSLASKSLEMTRRKTTGLLNLGTEPVQQQSALVGGTNWRLAPTATYANRQLQSALVGWCVPSITVAVYSNTMLIMNYVRFMMT